MSDNLEKFNQLNILVSVEDVFDYIGADLAKDDGFRLTYACPYHTDDSPSLLVDKENGSYNCFACECGGRGAYSCAKYYLTHQNNSKPTVMMVVDFLCEINNQVEHIKHLFNVKRVREYEYGQNKRDAFNGRIKGMNHQPFINVARKNLSGDQLRNYIDAIMTGMPDEIIVKIISSKKQKSAKEESKAFLSLLEE